MAKARGSGSGNGNRQTPPNDDDDDDDDGGGGDGGGNNGFTDAQRDELRRMINATTSAQLGRKLDTAIKTAVDGALGPISEQLTKLAGGGEGGEGGGKGKSKEPPAGGGTGGGKDPEVEAMRKRLAALEDERKTERAQADARERDASLREHLTKIGVDPNRMRGAVAVIRENVKKDPETGEWSYKAQRDGYVDDLDLAKGVAEWGNTDEGKSYRAAQGKGAGGNGAQRQATTGQINVIGQRQGTGGGNAGKAAKEQAAEQKQERKVEAVDKLGAAVNALIGGANIDVG